MAEQRLPLKITTRSAYFLLSLVPESVLDDRIQYLFDDSHGFNNFVVPKFREFPSLIQSAAS